MNLPVLKDGEIIQSNVQLNIIDFKSRTINNELKAQIIKLVDENDLYFKDYNPLDAGILFITFDQYYSIKRPNLMSALVL